MSSSSSGRLSPQRARVLRVVSDLGGDERALLLHDVSDVVGGHPNTSRLHLDALADAGLLDVERLSPAGVGRPPRGYRLTAEGKRALLRMERSHSHEIVGAVAAWHVDRPDASRAAEEIGAIWGAREAAQTAQAMGSDGVDSIVEILDILGFEPQRGHDEIVLHACPLLEDGSPDEPTTRFACTLHAGMVRGALRTMGRSEEIELRPFVGPDTCAVRLLSAQSA